jgi:hypothetical protein
MVPQVAVTSAVALLFPQLALACPVCFAGGSEQVLHTYLLSAACLSLLPLAIVALFAGWLRQRFKNHVQ